MTAAAAASLATSEPPLDEWFQSDELPAQSVRVARGEPAALSVYLEMPPVPLNASWKRRVAFSVGSSERGPVDVSVRRDGESRECQAVSPFGGRPEPDVYGIDATCLDAAGDVGDGAGPVRQLLHFTFALREIPWPGIFPEAKELRVSFEAFAQGDERDAQAPPVSLELR